jgi:hypothetical protein
MNSAWTASQAVKITFKGYSTECILMLHFKLKQNQQRIFLIKWNMKMNIYFYNLNLLNFMDRKCNLNGL